MKTILLAMAVAGFAVSSASAQCSHGVANISQPLKNLAMSTPVAKPQQVASLSDAWLIKYLDKAQS